MSSEFKVQGSKLFDETVPEAQNPEPGTRNSQLAEGPQRLHPLTLVQRVLVSLPALAFLLLPLLRSPNQDAWLSLFAAVLYGVVALPLIALRYYRFRYRITPKEVVIDHGVFRREHRSIPIERVQNVQITRSLVPRLFGTAKVKIETAGSSSTEGTLEYVSLDEAQRIRQIVRAYQQQQAAPEAETSVEEAAPKGDVLFTMTLQEVLLSGAFRFSLIYIAMIFSGLELLGLDVEEAVALFTQGPLHGAVVTVMASPWLTVLVSVLAATLLGWLTGIAINLNRYFGFQLRREGNKLHKKHGLLTLSEGTIPLEKVQALILRTNPLMRAFGFFRLELQTMGVDLKEQGHLVAVPFAKREEVLRLAQEIRPLVLPDAFAPVSRLTIRRTFLRLTTLLLAIVLPVTYFFWQPALWGLLLVPFLGLYAVARYRRLGYAQAADAFFVRSGVFQQYLWALPTEKHQVFYTSATLFQRRLGLASLYVDTAGAIRFTGPDVPDLPAPAAKTLLDTLYTRFQQRF